MNTDTKALFVPDCVTVQRIVTVPKEIPAMSLVPSGTGTRLGQIVSLPKGSRLEVCGHGFNVRTIKARCNGHLYFVFLQDLEVDEALVRTAEAARV